ncbi:beta-ketoacyl-ACP synthase III, partial [bacterium]|nr:beta-ketoacyl-ACP synthase III [bacterium]
MVKRMMERMEDDVQELLVIPHQASPKAVELIRRRLGYSEDQFINVAADYGNMAAASISFVIDHLRCNQMCQQNDQVLLLGTSAGYSQAGLIFRI